MSNNTSLPNCLSQLLGDYISDDESSNDEENVSCINNNNNNNNKQLNAEVNKFMNEIINDSKIKTSPSSPPPPPPPITFWTECIDKNTGHPYYWNTETKEVTWQLPPEYDEYLKNTISTEADRWIMCHTDDDNKQRYYVNEYTRKVSWEKPIMGIICNLIMKTDNESGNAEMITTKSSITNNDSTKKIIEPELTIIEKLSDVAVKKLHQTADKKRLKNSLSTKKKYPSFINDVIDEKIELITSFDCKSNSSSDNEMEPLEKTIPNNLDTNTLTLVASEYNSDDDNNNNLTENNSKKCVFPISSASSVSIPTTSVIVTLSTNKIHNSQHQTLKDNINNEEIEATTSTSSSSSSSSSTDEIPVIPISKINTFASIITGGRDPNESELTLLEHGDLLQKNDDEQLKGNHEVEMAMENSIELNKKLFKRKRRIEFNTSISKMPKYIKIGSDRDTDSNRTIELDNNVLKGDGDGADADKKSYNNNFQLSHIEFGEGSASVGMDTSKDNPMTLNNDKNGMDTCKNHCDDADVDVNEKEIMNLKIEINGKLKFLCDIKNVTPAQLLFIQFQTLFEAYERKALQSAYILNWLTNLSNDIRLFEKDAVPNGWKCYWNRNKCQYYYKHMESGKVQVDYPQIDDDHQDDDNDKLNNVQNQCDVININIPKKKTTTTTTTESELPSTIIIPNNNIPKILATQSAATNHITSSTEVDEELMDICTTPPPPPAQPPSIIMSSQSPQPLPPIISSLTDDVEFIQKYTVVVDDAIPPEPPKWDHAISAKIFDEPLPPGIDISEYERSSTNPAEKNTKSLTIELASFYSDLAILETVVTAAPSTTIPLEDSHDVISSSSSSTQSQSSNTIINPIDLASVGTTLILSSIPERLLNTIDDLQQSSINQTAKESNEMINDNNRMVSDPMTMTMTTTSTNIVGNVNSSINGSIINNDPPVKRIKKEKITKVKKVKVRRTCETDLNNWINKWQKAQKELDG